MSTRKAAPRRQKPDRALLLWCGRELLLTMREIFDELGLGAGFDFDAWVDGAPMPPSGRRAVAMARAQAQGERE